MEQSIDAQIRLKSLAGQLVHTDNFNGTNHQIRVTDLSKGIYFLHLQSEEGYLVWKVIVQ